MPLVMRGQYAKPLIVIRNSLILLQAECGAVRLHEMSEDLDVLSGGLTALLHLLNAEFSAELKSIYSLREEIMGVKLVAEKIIDFIIRKDDNDNDYIFATFPKGFDFDEQVGKDAVNKLISLSSGFKGDRASFYEEVKGLLEGDKLFLKRLFKSVSEREILIKDLEVQAGEIFMGFSSAVISMMSEIFGIHKNHFIVAVKTAGNAVKYYYASPLAGKVSVWRNLPVFFEVSEKFSYLQNLDSQGMIKFFNKVLDSMPAGKRNDGTEFKKMLLSMIGSENPEYSEQVAEAVIKLMKGEEL